MKRHAAMDILWVDEAYSLIRADSIHSTCEYSSPGMTYFSNSLHDMTDARTTDPSISDEQQDTIFNEISIEIEHVRQLIYMDFI